LTYQLTNKSPAFEQVVKQMSAATSQATARVGHHTAGTVVGSEPDPGMLATGTRVNSSHAYMLIGTCL